MVEFFNESHIADMAEIERECFKEPWTEAMLREELKNPAALFFCFCEKNRVSGYTGMHKVLDEGHITNIGVKPVCRRKGIAKALLKYVIEYCIRSDIGALTLEVRVSNTAAISLYKKAGFEIEGMRKRFYSDGEDAFIMWNRDLSRAIF